MFEEGDSGIDLYVIRSGRIQISRDGPDGRRAVATLGPGEFFGEMSVVLGEVRTARAVAVGWTELLEVDGEMLEQMCMESPEIAIRIIQRLATRLITAERRLAALGLDQVVGPIVRYLVAHSSVDAGEELRLTTTLRELAQGCHLSLQETHEALHQLMDRKLVRLTGEELIAPDRAALTAAVLRLAQSA